MDHTSVPGPPEEPTISQNREYRQYRVHHIGHFGGPGSSVKSLTVYTYPDVLEGSWVVLVSQKFGGFTMHGRSH